MSKPMRVRSNGKIVRQNKKQVWLKDDELVTYDSSWEAINPDVPLNTYDNKWEDLSGDDKLEVYGSSEEEIGTVDDYTGGGEDKVTVRFLNYDGAVLKTQKVNKGGTPTAPANPTKPADAQYTYTFDGWSPAIGPVNEDTDYTAQYTETIRSYTVTWLNYDGTELETDTVEYGQTPSYSGEEPTKEGEYFNGWEPEISIVTEDVVYTATFTPTPPVIEIYPASLVDVGNCNWDNNFFNGSKIGLNSYEYFSLDFSTPDTLYRSINGLEPETITDASVISEYLSYINDLMDGSSSKNLTENQYNHLLDITQALDTTEYSVSQIYDETHGQMFVVAKYVNGVQQESMSFYTQYGNDREWVRLFNGVTTIRTWDSLAERINMTLNNAIYNGGVLFSEDQYNFLKLYNDSSVYMYYNILESTDGENRKLYSNRIAYKSGGGYVFESGTIIIDDGTQLINESMGPTTYYVTGSEYTADLAWIQERVQNRYQSYEDYNRFNQLGYYNYRTREVQQNVLGIIYNYEAYEKEEYSVFLIDGGTDYEMSISTRDSYESGSVMINKILTAQGAAAFLSYCQTEGIVDWQDITQAQYQALKNILDNNSALAQYTVTIVSNNASMGAVDVNSVIADDGTAVSANDNILIIGSNTITATPESGYIFVGWDNLPAEVKGNWQITARFEPEV